MLGPLEAAGAGIVRLEVRALPWGDLVWGDLVCACVLAGFPWGHAAACACVLAGGSRARILDFPGDPSPPLREKERIRKRKVQGKKQK